MSTDRQVYNGSCLCESVKYTLRGLPWLSYLCHCRTCQRANGSAFNANCFFPRHQLSVVQGKDKVSVYPFGKTGSGSIQHRYFCAICGSPLYILPENKPEVVVVCAGTLNNFSDFKPEQECWAKQRVSWVQPVPDVESYEGSRPITSGRPGTQ
jgi:hypothetical protein